MDTIKLKSGSVQMIAHRGASGIEPANTCPAFAAAGSRSYFGIETDIHVTADNRFIVYHDNAIQTEDGRTLVIEQTDFDTLRSLVLPGLDGTKYSCGPHMPSLEDYFSLCKKYDKTALLELKNRFAPARLAEVAEIAKAFGWLERTIFISFDIANLDGIRRLYPKQPVQFLTGSCDDALIEVLASKKMDIDIAYQSLDKKQIEKLHKKGIRINCWTCNNPEDAQKLISLGVDFITSDILE